MRKLIRPTESHSPTLVSDLERDLCPCCRNIARRVIKRYSGQRLRIRLRDAVFPDDLALAISLLNDGLSRAESRDALMVRLEVGRSKAYQLLDAALQARTVIPPTHPQPAGLRQLAVALDEED